VSNNRALNFQKGRCPIKSPAFFLCFFVLVIVTSTLTYCKHPEEIKEVSCSSLLVDSITFPFNKIDFGSVIYGENRKSNMYFYSDGDYLRCIRYNGDGKPLDTIKYPASISSMLTGFYPITKDSFAILTHQQLFIYAAKSKKIHVFNLPIKGFRFEGYRFAGSPLEVCDSLAFFFRYEDTLIINTQKNLELYLDSSHHEMVFNLNRDRAENIKAGEFPKEIYGRNSYYSVSISRCINKEKHELIYTYPHSKNIYIFNYLNKTLKKITVQDPVFISNDTFDFNKVGDFDYITKYQVENCRFRALKYNKFRKEYYMPVVYKSNYEIPNSDEVVRFIDKPWSILVLDSNFSIKEKINFPGKKYNFDRILPLQKGVLVGYYSNIKSKKDSSKYAVFEF